MATPKQIEEQKRRRVAANDLPPLPVPGLKPVPPPPAPSLATQAGNYVQQQFQGARQAVAQAARPLIEPFVQGQPVVDRFTGAVQDFSRAAVGAQPLAIPSPIPAAAASTQATRPVVPPPSAPPLPVVQKPAAPAVNPLYANLEGPAAATALGSTAPGTAVISGKFAGQEAPETRSYNAAGLADAASRVNVVSPGAISDLMFDPGGHKAAEQRAATQAAADRGDWEAVERSGMSREERAEADTRKAEDTLIRRTSRAQGKLVPEALAAIGGVREARQGKPAGLDEVRAQRAIELQAGAPPNPNDAQLFSSGRQPLARGPEFIKETDPETQIENTYLFDPATGTKRPVPTEGAEAATPAAAGQPELQEFALRPDVRAIVQAQKAGKLTREEAKKQLAVLRAG